jgi:hypothetical protein
VIPLPAVPASFDALIDGIKRERGALETTLARVPVERMSELDAVGAWSVKDVLAHLAVWLSRDITMLFTAERTGKPQPAHIVLGTRDWDKVNAKDHATQQDRALELVLSDFRGTHTQLLRRLEGWRAKDARLLFDARAFPTMQGVSLAAEIWAGSGEHDHEHRLDIEAWLNRGA